MKGLKAHFVPVFYLENFGKKRIYLYDKQTRKDSPSTPKQVAFQRRFYADSNDDASKLEKAMRQLEGSSRTVLSNIIETGSIAGLPDADKEVLCAFTAFQFARTPEFRDWRREMVQSGLDALVAQMGITDWRLVEEDDKSAHLTAMLDSIDMVGPCLFQMRVNLFRNDTDMPLWTSDNPVVRHNSLTSKLGAGSPGVQFYLPLTPNLLLVFYDGTYADLLDDAGEYDDDAELWMRVSNSPETDSMDEADVIHANRLQAMFSTRFVYSNKPDFHMMGEFLEAIGSYKKRTVFSGPASPDTISRADMLNRNLQNALWWYRAARQDADMYRAFMGLFESLKVAANMIFGEDGKEFDDAVRKLTGDPELPIDRLRQLRDRIRRKEYADLQADGTDMAKRVAEMRRIVARAILSRLKKLRADD